ncbi:hypothetical protein V8E36_004805 [Tilletia maclaganii]
MPHLSLSSIYNTALEMARLLPRGASDDPIDLLSESQQPPEPSVTAPNAPAPSAATSTPPKIHADPGRSRLAALNDASIADSLQFRRVNGSGSGSGSSSSSSSSSSSIFSANGRLQGQSQLSSPATSRSNSAHEGHISPPELAGPSAKSQGKRRARDELSNLLGTIPTTASPAPDVDDGRTKTTVPAITDSIFPLTLYNSAYRFFPHHRPFCSKAHSAAHPPSEAQCPWVVQEGAWGKEAVRCGRSFASPEMLARHVLLTHCHIDCPGASTQDHKSRNSSTSSSQAASVVKVSCRYGSCSHRTFTSTDKMRAHVIQNHLLPAFLFICPFENCRLSHTEQPDAQHKLDGHIDRIHDEEAEKLRPFARVGGLGPRGARFSLLHKVPASIMDKDKGGVQPGAAWAYMTRSAAVSGISLDSDDNTMPLAEPPSGASRKSGLALTPTSSRILASTEKVSETQRAASSASGSSYDHGLNSVEKEIALKINSVEKAPRITATELDGHWLHQPLARRPPLPCVVAPKIAKSGAKGSPVKAAKPNFKAIFAASAEAVANQRLASAAFAKAKLTPSERSIVYPPHHPASSQTLLIQPTCVQPYASLLAKMSYLQEPATPLLPSESMLLLEPPAASSARAGEVYERRLAEARNTMLARHAVTSPTGVDGSAVMASGLPQRQQLLDVFIDRPARTVALGDIEFIEAGAGTFDCVEVPSREDIKDWDWDAYPLHQATVPGADEAEEQADAAMSDAVLDGTNAEMADEAAVAEIVQEVGPNGEDEAGQELLLDPIAGEIEADADLPMEEAEAEEDPVLDALNTVRRSNTRRAPTPLSDGEDSDELADLNDCADRGDDIPEKEHAGEVELLSRPDGALRAAGGMESYAASRSLQQPASDARPGERDALYEIGKANHSGEREGEPSLPTGPDRRDSAQALAARDDRETTAIAAADDNDAENSDDDIIFISSSAIAKADPGSAPAPSPLSHTAASGTPLGGTQIERERDPWWVYSSPSSSNTSGRKRKLSELELQAGSGQPTSSSTRSSPRNHPPRGGTTPVRVES